MKLFFQKIKELESSQLIQGIFWFSIVIGLLYVTIKLSGADNLQEKVQEFGTWGPVIFILAKMSTIVLAPIGGSPLYVAAVALFGFHKAFIYSFIADTAAYIIVFYLSRKYGRRIINRMVPEKIWRVLEKVLHRLGTWKGLVGVRLMLIGMGDMISYAAGLTQISFHHYFFVTLPFVVINILFFTTIGELVLANKFLFILAVVVLIGSGAFFLLRSKSPNSLS